MVKQVLVATIGLLVGSVVLAAEPEKWTMISPSDLKAESKTALDKWVNNFANLGNYEVWSATSRELYGKPYVGQSVLRMEASRAGRFLFAWTAPWETSDTRFTLFDGKVLYRGTVKFGETMTVTKGIRRRVPTVNGQAGMSADGLDMWDSLVNHLGADDVRQLTILGAGMPAIRPDTLCAAIEPKVVMDRAHLSGRLFQVNGDTATISICYHQLKPEIEAAVNHNLAGGDSAKVVIGPDGRKRTVEKTVLLSDPNVTTTETVLPDGRIDITFKQNGPAATNPLDTATGLLRDPANYVLTQGRKLVTMTLDAKTGLPTMWEPAGTGIRFNVAGFKSVAGTDSVLPAKVILSSPVSKGSDVRRDGTVVTLTGVRAKVEFDKDSFDPAKLTLESLSPKTK
ncbi:MAG TPA: hypothetical protein PKY77_22355 [Phycisphaerae bacterium]|nr:hypothetical protein [Phycisphaerae bacterium]HRY71266.1 hypothetical protein [Phycisphaerae bacterium]HSA29642.1 hypothetical protein [Phycisphaerae bacterium]